MTESESVQDQVARRWPTWLVDVEVRVDELVEDPVVMDRFRRMLRDWKLEHVRRGPMSPVPEDLYPDSPAEEVLPLRRFSLAEKYAHLAAIHDVICEKAKRIDPWTMHKSLSDVGFAKAKAGMAYVVLCKGVRDLREKDRERIENALRDVEIDLAGHPSTGVELPTRAVTEYGGFRSSETGGDDADFRPASWFAQATKIKPSRLRTAANPKRKSKRVRTRIIDGVVCYSMSDARLWWSNDMPDE